MTTPDANSAPSFEDKNSALFASLVLQQSNMAMMFLGKVAHPETGQATKDLEAARMFIDMLEMLEARTKGNLSAAEAGMLTESLTSLRLAFVEAAQETPTSSKSTGAAPAAEQAAPESTGDAGAAQPAGETSDSAAPAPAAGGESRKKFVKKY